MVRLLSIHRGFVLASKPNMNKPRESILDETLISKILRRVPEREGFHFYRNVGDPTGETAVSLVDFLSKMKVVDVQSISFHFHRKDFETWIKEVIGDAELALRIGRIRTVMQSEALRNEIIHLVKARLNEFANLQ
jgi:hypothetical protein